MTKYSKKTCKHVNCTITEHGIEFTEHIFVHGKWYHSSSSREYTGTLDVLCFDCGLRKTYNRYSKSFPKWLKQKFENILTGSDL